MAETGRKTRVKNILGGLVLAGLMLGSGPGRAETPCTNMPTELAGVFNRVIVAAPPSVVQSRCPALGDSALGRVNGQGFTLQVRPPQFQQAVILWDEGGSQGTKPVRASAQNDGLGNRQSNSVTFTSNATR